MKCMTDTVSFFQPLSLVKRGGSKMMLLPEGQVFSAQSSDIDPSLLKTLVRAHLFQRQLKSGKYPTMPDLSAAHNVTIRYAQRVLALSYLSPTLKEAILKGTHPKTLKLADLLGNVSMLWQDQI